MMAFRFIIWLVDCWWSRLYCYTDFHVVLCHPIAARVNKLFSICVVTSMLVMTRVSHSQSQSQLEEQHKRDVVICTFIYIRVCCIISMKLYEIFFNLVLSRRTKIWVVVVLVDDRCWDWENFEFSRILFCMPIHTVRISFTSISYRQVQVCTGYYLSSHNIYMVSHNILSLKDRNTELLYFWNGNNYMHQNCTKHK